MLGVRKLELLGSLGEQKAQVMRCVACVKLFELGMTKASKARVSMQLTDRKSVV